MKNLWIKVLGSLDTVTANSFSARKLSSFIFVWMSIIIELFWLRSSYIHNNWTHLLEVLASNLTFALTCLGLTTYSAIKKGKNKDNINE